MGGMQMPLPENTLPMMTGDGPFGGIEMGGMFTMVKVREGQGRNDYKDPGWYKHPPGTLAREWTGELPAAPRAPNTPASPAAPAAPAQQHQGHGAGHEGHVMEVKRGGSHQH
jgi:hypothetical protein